MSSLNFPLTKNSLPRSDANFHMAATYISLAVPWIVYAKLGHSVSIITDTEILNLHYNSAKQVMLGNKVVVDDGLSITYHVA